MNEILNVILRTLFVLVLLFFLFKLMGKKQVYQMSMFDYITGITIGSIVADISLDIDKNLPAGIVCLLIYCIINVLVDYFSLKSITLRTFLNGEAVPLIVNGKINRDHMAKNKITINNLQTEARLMGYFNLDEINNAILEPSGMISFEPFEKEKPATKKDMGVTLTNKGLVYNLIIDGKVLEDNLEQANKTKKWLNHELKLKGKKAEEVLLFTIDDQEKIDIYFK